MKLPGRRDLRRLSRGLRFRLTASYALFFAILLTGIAGLFRESLTTALQNQTDSTLNDYWAAVKGGFLRIDWDRDSDKYWANWYYDEDDPEEKTLALDIQKVFMITDQYGHVIQDIETKEDQIRGFDDLPKDPPSVIQARVREALTALRPGQPGKAFRVTTRSHSGEPFRLRAGIILAQHDRPGATAHEPFYVVLGTSYANYDKILHDNWLVYVSVIPISLILGSLLGWFMAGRALTPVREVAQTAQRISGSNLSLRIPSRQAGDELDYLILTFNRMIERLEASFQQMKQFSTDVSHELRTPITAIRGQLEVALFTAKTTEQYREAIFNALTDIDRLSQIVRALLLLSQAESGQLALQKSPLDIREVVQDLAEQYQIPAEAAGIHLSADAAAKCVVYADRVQIERMITNLLSNAIKFTPEGGQVHISARTVDEHAEIVVEDTGRGIPTEHLPHIFDRFYRVPGSNAASAHEQGLGLGLSFVAWIVKVHKGTIDVDSHPGRGTRFTIKLPAAGVGADTLELTTQSA
ncbi:MAG TPA: heavy metal sensor histidine kinase [Bryobacteraceae bacterium]|nr:heavy metal sensor histidine kinase [Bryobacteraceae bacterium]